MHALDAIKVKVGIGFGRRSSEGLGPVGGILGPRMGSNRRSPSHDLALQASNRTQLRMRLYCLLRRVGSRVVLDHRQVAMTEQ